MASASDVSEVLEGLQRYKQLIIDLAEAEITLAGA